MAALNEQSTAATAAPLMQITKAGAIVDVNCY